MISATPLLLPAEMAASVLRKVPVSRPSSASLAFAAGVVLALGAGVFPGCGGKRPPPRETAIRSQRPFFVGHQRCAECHAEIAEDHAQTGHARTFRLTSESEIADKLCGKSLSPGAPYSDYTYICDQEGLAVESESHPGRLFPIEFALGSAEHATTFISLMATGTGETRAIEHRLTYYQSDESFDITPGQRGLVPTTSAEYFGKVYSVVDTQRCVACHTTTATISRGRVENLRAGVNCEKCHGPGSRHVAAAEEDLLPLARELIDHGWSPREEIMMCARCHRSPGDLDPERIRRYPRSIVRFQPVGLLQSRCFTESGGKLGCTTCHPPHQRAGQAAPHEQIASCLNCHSNTGQTHCPVSPQTDCIRCHMPPVGLVREIAFHDHWIRVRTGETASEREPISDAGHQEDPAGVQEAPHE